MLVLSRKVGQVVNGSISVDQLWSLLAEVQRTGQPVSFQISLIELRGNGARLGLEFPIEIDLQRDDVKKKAA